MQLMIQVASGLDKAHGYIDKDGQLDADRPSRFEAGESVSCEAVIQGEPLVKILDFGIAKVVSEGTHVSQEIKGTPLFMAYEQAGGGRIMPRTDVWALGLIVFWLLTGKHYWRTAQEESGGGITQLFGEVISMPISSATERAIEFGFTPSWLPSFDEWFTKCVNRDQNQRFGSAGEAVTALAATLGIDRLSGLPGMTASQGFGLRQAPVGGVTSADGLGAPKEELRGTGPGAAGASGTKGMAVVLVALAVLVIVGGAIGAFLFLRSNSAPGKEARPETPAAMQTATTTTASAAAVVVSVVPDPGPSARPVAAAPPVSAVSADTTGSAGKVAISAKKPTTPAVPGLGDGAKVTPPPATPPTPTPAKTSDPYGER